MATEVTATTREPALRRGSTLASRVNGKSAGLSRQPQSDIVLMPPVACAFTADWNSSNINGGLKHHEKTTKNSFLLARDCLPALLGPARVWCRQERRRRDHPQRHHGPAGHGCQQRRSD